jgi:hypothetical protein
MWRTSRVDVNGRAEFCEPPRRACMIKMDMAQKHVPNVFRARADFAESGDHVGKRRLGTGVEKSDAIRRF